MEFNSARRGEGTRLKKEREIINLGGRKEWKLYSPYPHTSSILIVGRGVRFGL